MAISIEDARTGLEHRPRKERPGRELVADAFRALAHPVVVGLLRLRVPPPAVVFVHTAIGLAAAIAIGSGALVAAAVLLQLKTLLDNADGQLARATGSASVLGRYLDTEADLLVNASLFAAIAVAVDVWWLAPLAFCALTFLLSVNHNVAVLYGEARGWTAAPLPSSGSRVERGLTLVYETVFAPQDRLLRALSRRRLDRALADESDEGRRELATLAYHDRATATIVANLGLSTQLFVLGACLVLGVPDAYLWFVLASLLLPPVLQLRRERLARRALAA